MLIPLPVVTPVDTTPNPHFGMLGGEVAVRRVAERFYDLMDQHPENQTLRALHAADLGPSRQKLFEFLCGWLGGPDYFVAKHGPPRLRQRHQAVPIGDRERDQWMRCMTGALAEEPIPDDSRQELTRAFQKLADFLRNQPPR